MRPCLLILMAVVVGLSLSPGLAAGGPYGLALVIGNNEPAGEDLDRLRFADDDAFKYATFMSFIADKVRLYTRADDESAPLYRTGAAVAPTREAVLAAMDEVAHEAEQRAAAGDDVVVYFVFSGHGNYDAEGRGYLHLEDGKLTTRDLFYHLISRSDSFRLVLLIDACNASFLVKSRGGSDRRVAGPPTLDMERYENVGLVLSSSSVGEVKEWGRYLAGIFSHQVRSALAGVADVDGDNRITFQELASFVEAANRAVENPELRITPYIRPPAAAPDMPLVDFTRARFPRSLSFGFEADTRVTVFDEDMVRYADFHVGAGYHSSLALTDGREYFVLVGVDREYLVPAASTGMVELGDLESRDASILASKGIDQYYVKHLFSIPYDRTFATSYLGGEYQSGLVFERRVRRPWYKNEWGWLSAGAGVAFVGLGGYLQTLAQNERNAARATPWANVRATHNDRIERYNNYTLASALAGGAAIAGGVALFIFQQPMDSHEVAPQVGPGMKLVPAPGGAMLEGTF